MELKCSKCGVDKSIDNFTKNLKKKLGVNTICKSCHALYRRDNYLLNKDKVLAQVKSYKQENPEKYNDKNKKAGRIIESACKVCSANIFITKKDLQEGRERFCSKECRATTNNTPYQYQIMALKKRAGVKGLDFDLDESYILDLLEKVQSSKCAITGVPIQIKKRHEESLLYKTASLDRIKNDKGYIKGNVQWVLLGVNYMKNDASDTELKNTLDLILKYYKGQ